MNSVGRRVMVTGMGVVSSVGCSTQDLETALRTGRSGIVGLPSGASPANGVRAGAFLRGFSWEDWLGSCDALDDPTRVRARKVLANTTDSARWSVVAALQAWLAAGLLPGSPAGQSTALVVAGSNLSQGYGFENAGRFINRSGWINPKYAVSFWDTNQLGCVSEILGIGGLGWTTGAASASGNVALFQAWQLIRTGVCERCLVVGAGFEFSAVELEALALLGAASTQDPVGEEPAALCCPFDAAHSGFVAGEGAGAMVLEADGGDLAADRSRAVIGCLLGASVGLDGTHLPEPSLEGEARAMSEALKAAGLRPEDVDYINAHGSGSPLGDRTECAAIRRALGGSAGKAWINSTKAFTGHCVSASGVLEAIATLLQLRGGFLHGNPHLINPIDSELRFVGRQASGLRAHRALSNGFGFGGINSSLVLATVS